MKLNATKETVFKVDYRDIEELIEEEYGKRFELVADQLASNDSTIEICDVNPDDIDEDVIKEFIETGHYSFLLNSLMNDLCKNGHIEAGDYIITICW